MFRGMVAKALKLQGVQKFSIYIYIISNRDVIKSIKFTQVHRKYTRKTSS
jgi:hypothetical protein